jgi:hypothetical protein
MRRALVIGVDPGLTTGVFAVPYIEGIAGDALIAVQVLGSEGVVPIVTALLDRSALDSLLAVEAFVVGPRASRSSSAHAGRVTRALIRQLGDLADDEPQNRTFVSRPAAAVKPWATDKRLEAAGLLAHTTGMHHARDAARHALFAAVHAGLTRDPLSAKAAAR